ncbi:hypothetical protein pb186bvf_006088 [Paramecium bursaria]
MIQDSQSIKVKLNFNALSTLKEHSIVSSNTGKFKEIKKFQPNDATTNPSLILEAAKTPEYKYIIEAAIQEGINVYRQQKKAQENLIQVEKNQQILEIPNEQNKPFLFKELSLDEQKEALSYISDQVSVNFGLEILKLVPGYISTQVAARLSYDVMATQEKAKQIIKMYEKAGISKDRILIKIAGTWEGIQAAKALQQEGINCNMTLIFNLHQAIACAQSGIKLISPFVGSVRDWFKEKYPEQDFSGKNHPGVKLVSNIFNYFKYHKHDTIILAASVRSFEEAVELSGIDRITMVIPLLEELQQAEGLNLEKQLQNPNPSEKIHIDEKIYRWELNQDSMATEKLAGGIKKFAEDLDKLEIYLRQLLEE